jgi:hypothetical protein
LHLFESITVYNVSGVSLGTKSTLGAKPLQKDIKTKKYKMCLEVVDSMFEISKDSHDRIEALLNLMKDYEKALIDKS